MCPEDKTEKMFREFAEKLRKLNGASEEKVREVLNTVMRKMDSSEKDEKESAMHRVIRGRVDKIARVKAVVGSVESGFRLVSEIFGELADTMMKDSGIFCWNDGDVHYLLHIIMKVLSFLSSPGERPMFVMKTLAHSLECETDILSKTSFALSIDGIISSIMKKKQDEEVVDADYDFDGK